MIGEVKHSFWYCKDIIRNMDNIYSIHSYKCTCILNDLNNLFAYLINLNRLKLWWNKNCTIEKVHNIWLFNVILQPLCKKRNWGIVMVLISWFEPCQYFSPYLQREIPIPIPQEVYSEQRYLSLRISTGYTEYWSAFLRCVFGQKNGVKFV